MAKNSTPPPSTVDERAGERLLARMAEVDRIDNAESDDFALLDPMTDAEEVGLVDVLLQAQRPARSATARPAKPWWRRGPPLGAFALAASFALLWWSPGTEEPRYRLETSSADARMRGKAPTDGWPRHHQGSRVAFVLRPDRRAEASLEPRLVELTETGPVPLTVTWQTAPSGAFRVESQVAELLPDRTGVITLAFSVAPPGEAVAWPADTRAPVPPSVMTYRFEIPDKQ